MSECACACVCVRVRVCVCIFRCVSSRERSVSEYVCVHFQMREQQREVRG